MKSRLLIVFGILILLWAGLIARGFALQVFPDKRLTTLLKKQFQRKLKTSGQRGVIFDRNGNELAISITAYSLFADPKLIKEPKKVARRLSKELKVPFKKTYSKLKKNKRRFVWIRRKLDREQMLKIKKWKNRGLGFVEEPKRIYPNGTLLANVLGFVGSDGQGLEGIEKQYNSYLSGVDREVIVRRDARGRPLMVNQHMFAKNHDGNNLYLTIDRDLQFHLEKELENVYQKNKADSAVGVILDARTSEVLAMANYPTFDPNRPHKTEAKWRRNRSVTDAFEPGSTMKTILMGAALREGVITPNKKYFCENGKFQVGNRFINEADEKHHFGWLTASEVLAHSSNIGTTKIAFDLGAEKYREGLTTFGFGAKTGIDFPGEARGILNALPWRPHQLSNISFGHAVSSTPLQMVNAYAAIANGGVWKQPHLLRDVQTKWGERVGFERNLKEQRILSSPQAAQLSFMLNSVTGTGGPVVTAHVPGFPVAGKTGTAQKVKETGRGYARGKYISSFAGFVPAHSPKYVIYVAVDNPKKIYYGAQVAAPVFSNIASFALRRSGMTPVLISKDNLLNTQSEKEVLQKKALEKLKIGPSKLSRVPNFKGLTLREVQRHVQKRDLNVRLVGSGVVAKTNPPAGFPLPNDEPIEVYLSLSQ